MGMPEYYKNGPGYQTFTISFPCSDMHRTNGWCIRDRSGILYNVPLTKDQSWREIIDPNALGYPPKTGWKIYEGEPDALTVVPVPVEDCEWGVAKLLPPYVPTVDPSSIHRLPASEAAGHA